MRKEALFAIFIGIVVGLGITYGIYKIRQVVTPPTPKTNQTDSSFTDEQILEEAVSEKLFITVPEEGTTTTTDSITLSGNAEPNELIVVLLHDDQYITKSDDIGAFAQTLELQDGGNVIQVFAISNDGTQRKKQIFVAKEKPEETIESTSSASLKEEQ